MAVQQLDTERRRRTYEAPGIYRRLQVNETTDVRLVRTDVAGFVGFTERGPLATADMDAREAMQTAVRLTSWKEYVSTFGWFLQYSHLAYAVRGFFENGGTTCYVVRTAATKSPLLSKQPATAHYTFPGISAAGSITAATALKSAATRGDVSLQVETTKGFFTNDLVRMNGKGVQTFSVIESIEPPHTVHLSSPVTHLFENGSAIFRYNPALQIAASSMGSWGNRLRLLLIPLEHGHAVTEFSLRITVDRGRDLARPFEEEFYNRLSLHPKSEVFAPRIINKRSHLITIPYPTDSTDQIEDLSDIEIPSSAIPLLVQDDIWKLEAQYLQGGRDGLDDVTPSDLIGGTGDLRGLRLLEEIDEVSILCMPDAVSRFAPRTTIEPPRPPSDPCRPSTTPSTPLAKELPVDETSKSPSWTSDKTTPMYRAMIDQCERLRDRVAILDYPPTRSVPTAAQLLAWRNQFVTRFGAIYYPWFLVPDAANPAGPPRPLPPSGHVAGIYARIDNQFGVQRPPGNEPFEFVTDVQQEISSLQQEQLNPYGINVIRSFPGRGIRIWGVRSLAKAEADPVWQFIHVRRVMSMIEESVDESMQWAVFEPNDEALRKTVVHSLSVFLEAIWQRGGLKGNMPSEGFYVKCDETNNPQSVIDAGQLVCEIGVAVAAPMEFLVFEIRNSPSGAAVVEL